MEITFQLNPYKRRDGLQMIMLRYSHKGKPVQISTEERILAKYWDAKKKRVKKMPNDEHLDINETLDTIRKDVKAIARGIRQFERKPPFSYLVKAEYKRQKDLDAGLDFWGYWELYREQTDHNRKSGSRANVKNSRAIYEEFASDTKFHFSFVSVDELFYQKFLKWYKERDNKEYSTKIRLSYLRSFLKHALKKGWCNNPVWESWPRGAKAPGGKTTLDLTIHEINLLEDLPPLSDKHQAAKDRFLFHVYTGLRFADANEGNYEIVQEREFNTLRYINNKASKEEDGKVSMLDLGTEGFKIDEIPIIDKAQIILDRYNGIPPVSNTDGNRWIKKIAEFAGIKDAAKVKISRTSRKTFATLLSKYNAPDDLISIGLSHSQKKGLLSTYVNQSRKREEHLKGLFDFLSLTFSGNN